MRLKSEWEYSRLVDIPRVLIFVFIAVNPVGRCLMSLQMAPVRSLITVSTLHARLVNKTGHIDVSKLLLDPDGWFICCASSRDGFRIMISRVLSPKHRASKDSIPHGQ